MDHAIVRISHIKGVTAPYIDQSQGEPGIGMMGKVPAHETSLILLQSNNIGIILMQTMIRY